MLNHGITQSNPEINLSINSVVATNKNKNTIRLDLNLEQELPYDFNSLEFLISLPNYDNTNEIEIDTESLHVVNEAMWRVIYDNNIGTASHIKKIDSLEFAGKTGTAQVYNLDKGKTGKKSLQDHALFISFAPFESPEIVVSVIVDNGGSGSAVAAPIARDIINFYFEKIKSKVALQ